MDAEDREWQEQQQQQQNGGFGPSVSGAAFTAASRDASVAQFNPSTEAASPSAAARAAAGGASPLARQPSNVPPAGQQQQQQQQPPLQSTSSSLSKENNNGNSGDGSQQQDGGSAAASPSPAGGAVKKKKVFHGDNLEYRYPSGSVYHGSFRDGKLNGYGVYKYHPSGDVYEGEWLNDNKHGRGTYTYDGGDRYVGEWKHGRKEGRGAYYFTNGDEYLGSWRGDKIDGWGVFTVARNGNRYEGMWVESYRHGMGVLRSGNGNIYEGQWARGKEHGDGVLLYPDGKFYAGPWKAGKMDGKGILFEGGVKYLVEHVGGFLVAEKHEVPEDAMLDPVYNAANKLYDSVRRVQAARTNGILNKSGGGGGSAADSTDPARQGGFLAFGGPAATANYNAEKTRVELEMLQKKYESLLQSRGTPVNGFVNENDPASVAEVEPLRQLVREARAQRDAQRRRADEAKEEAAALQARVDELVFTLDAVRKSAVLDDARTGASLDPLELQRRIVQLEAQMHDVREAGNGASAASRGIGAGAGGASAGAAGAAAVVGGSRVELDLQAKIQLLEGENAALRKSKDELAKARQEATELRDKVRDGEFRVADLERQLQTQQRRGQHDSAQETAALQQRAAAQAEEIRELHQRVAAAQAETEAAVAKHKAMIDKMRAAEAKALQAGDLEAQLDMLRKSRAKETAALERKSEECDQLKQQNATLAREVEELTASSARGRLPVAAGGGGGLGSGAGGIGSSANLHAAADFEARIAQIEKEKAEREKKEKKKMKKMLAERDDAVARLNEVSRRVGAMSMQLRCLVQSQVLTFARIVSVPRHKNAIRSKPNARVGPDGCSVVLGVYDPAALAAAASAAAAGGANETPAAQSDSKGVTFAVDAAFQPADGDEAIAASLRELCHAVPGGFNFTLVGFGAMLSGKSYSMHALLPLLLRDTLEACSSRNSTHEVSVTLQALELSVEGIRDLLQQSADGSADGAIKIVKDCYNSVVFSGCTAAPVANMQAFRDIAAMLQQRSKERRKRKRSHVLYVANCVFKHRVTGTATFGKLTVADLAGMASLGDQDDDIDSAQYVNSSMIKLQGVITALTTAGQTAVPYRDDPLTMALSDALGGNSRTVVLVHVPAESGDELLEHTTQSMSAASKAREIANAHVKRAETTEVIELRRAIVNLDGAAALPSGVIEIGTSRESA